MSVILAKNWWSLAIRGAVAIALGLIALAAHDVTIKTLVFAFFGYAFIDGLVALAGAVRAAESHERWASMLLEALAGMAVALIAVAWPAITALELIRLIAAWALATGVFEIASAIRLRKIVPGEWLLVLSGVASLVLGTLMAALPLAGATAIATWMGTYAVVFGALLLGLGLRLRGLLPSV